MSVGTKRVSVTVLLKNGRTVRASGSVSVNVGYPEVSTIGMNIGNEFNTAWTATKAAASRRGRSERGFWIFYNIRTRQYFKGNTLVGPTITGCGGTHGTIALGVPRITAREVIVVAHFHTHTPLTYCSNDDQRRTGPSEPDIRAYPGVPGIVYDYSAGTIYGGHSINADARTYYYGPERRIK